MYAVLQTSLEQSIDRDTLEEAVVATRELTKLDVPRLQRELFGIVAGDLSQGDALALQAALQARNIPTEVVDESVLPTLVEPKHGHALKLSPAGIVVVDLYDRETLYEWERIVFAAGGHLLHLKDAPFKTMEWVVTSGPRGSLKRGVEMVTDHRLENLPEFRLELFLPTESPRTQWLLTKDSMVTMNDAHLRFRDHDQLVSFLGTLGNALSPEQVNLGIKTAMTGGEFIYPSVHAFEEEIIWSFYQLMRNHT
jgi:hypothetical protein